MILIVSTPYDEHAQAVQIELTKLGAKTQLIDLSAFPQNLAMRVTYRGSECRPAFGCDEHGLSLADCRAIWWRRPQPPRISADIGHPVHQMFALTECAEALRGMWYGLEAFWINDPIRDDVAQRKAYQLRVAQGVGLRIPETLITNCVDAASAFITGQDHHYVVYKSFSALEEAWRETRIVGLNELSVLDHVRYCPVIFQEYVPAAVDLRITLVGDEIFPAAIYSQETSYKVDARMDLANARVEATRLPNSVEEQLRELMQRLGLVYGAVDMRRTPDGDHVFLEVNPAGQWLFVEERSGQRITAALARCLLEHA